jgi:hypothetical protein
MQVLDELIQDTLTRVLTLEPPTCMSNLVGLQSLRSFDSILTQPPKLTIGGAATL